jgi:hypothetical protein
MKASDIVTQMNVLLPQLTDKFTTDVAVKSITRSGTVMTALCNDKHRLEVGQAFAIVNSDVPIPISSLTKSGSLATLVTTTDHDLTNAITKTIRITGAAEAQFNGTFTRVNVVNRRTITFTVPDTSIFTYDNQVSKFAGVIANIFNESTVVAPLVKSTGSLKAVSIGGQNIISVSTSQVGGIGGVAPVDMSALTNFSFWVFVDSSVFANLRTTDAFRIRISSVDQVATDWIEFEFDKSAFTANTWIQLVIDIVNRTPDDTDGTIDLTKIISLVKFYIGNASFTAGDTIFYDDMDKGITIASGSPVLHDAESSLRDYNTTHKVNKVLDAVTFQFEQLVTSLPDPIDALIRIKPRISSGINLERIVQLYTKHEVDEYWAFVVIEDVIASQSRLLQSDALDNQQRNVNYRQQIIEPFTIYVFIPVVTEIAARESRDIAADLLRPILRSLLFSKLSTGLFADKLNTVQFTGHGVNSYDTALYIHSYSFQQVAEIYEEDTVGPDLDVAFRNIDFKIFLDFGTQVEFLQGTPDLDDTPL